jgi:hypothetical protein
MNGKLPFNLARIKMAAAHLASRISGAAVRKNSEIEPRQYSYFTVEWDAATNSGYKNRKLESFFAEWQTKHSARLRSVRLVLSALYTA